METIVKIKWDKPKDKNWLCPGNIELALSAYCKNTNFEVRELNRASLKTQGKADKRKRQNNLKKTPKT